MSSSWSPEARFYRTEAYKLLERTIFVSSRAFGEERERLQNITTAVDDGAMTADEAVRLFEAFFNRLHQYP